jgi:hypothetical protein
LVRVGGGVMVGVKDGDDEYVNDDVYEPVGGDSVRDSVGVSGGDNDTVIVGVLVLGGVIVLDSVTVDVLDAVAVVVAESVFERLRVCVRGGVTVDDSDAETVCDRLTECEYVCVGVRLTVGVGGGVMVVVGVPVTVTVSDAETLLDMDRVSESVFVRGGVNV